VREQYANGLKNQMKMNNNQTKNVPFVPFVPFVPSTSSTNSTSSTQPYRFILDKSSKKSTCPNCNKRTFVKYIDTETGEYLPEQYGNCDRLDNCNYKLNPYKDGYAKAIKHTELPKYWKPQQKKVIPQQTPELVFFDFDTFKQTLQPERYSQNSFIQNLLNSVQFPFEKKDLETVINLYRLGTVVNRYLAGAITFPFIDINQRIRAVQVKQFDKQNHTIKTTFLHSIIEKIQTQNKKPLPKWLNDYLKQDKKITCLFGEHLLSKYHSNPVALVEAPKSAVYGTLYFGLPDNPKNFIWLSIGAKGYLNFDKIKVLQGRNVVVFPDTSNNGNTYKEWETKVKEYQNKLSNTSFIFSDLLERLTSESQKQKGIDVADVLITHDWRKYRENNTKPKEQTKPEAQKEVEISKNQPALNDFILPFNSKKFTIDWSNDIAEIKNYFATIELPKQAIKLNTGTTITDCKKFVINHLNFVEFNNGKRTFLPYLERLKELRTIVNNNK
jgi:hypothetical protein